MAQYVTNKVFFTASPPPRQSTKGLPRTPSQVILSASPFCAAAPGIYQRSRDCAVYTAS